LAAELWTLSALARHVRQHAVAAGFTRLVQANKTTVWRILKEHDIKPHRIRYYLEKRNPDFDRKMREVLMVYQEVSLYADKTGQGDQPAPVYTVNVGEKPGVQAIGQTAPDLPPVPGRETSLARDYEYVRFGTLFILAALDLHTGEIIANVGSRSTAATSLLICSSVWTLITLLIPLFMWCSTVTRLIFPRKQWLIWRAVRDVSNIFIHPNMVHG
jgi:hypothetical protein